MFKLKYRQKLFVYLSAIFLVFTMLVLFLQYNREKSLKREQMEMNLDNIAELTFNYIQKKNLDPKTSYSQLDGLWILLLRQELLGFIR